MENEGCGSSNHFLTLSEDTIRPPSEWPCGCQAMAACCCGQRDPSVKPLRFPPVLTECTAWIWGRLSPGAPPEQSHVPGSHHTRLGPPGLGSAERLCAGLRRAEDYSHPYSAKYYSGQVPWELQNIPVFIYINAWLKKDPTCFPWQTGF